MGAGGGSSSLNPPMNNTNNNVFNSELFLNYLGQQNHSAANSSSGHGQGRKRDSNHKLANESRYKDGRQHGGGLANLINSHSEDKFSDSASDVIKTTNYNNKDHYVNSPQISNLSLKSIDVQNQQNK